MQNIFVGHDDDYWELITSNKPVFREENADWNATKTAPKRLRNSVAEKETFYKLVFLF